MKWVALQEPYKRIPQKFFLSQTDRMTERIRITTCSLMWIRAWSNLTLHLPTPAAQKLIYVIIQSQTVITFTDIESVPPLSTERIRTLSGNPRMVFWNWCAETLHILSSAWQPFWSNYWALQTESYQFWHLQILGIGSSSQRPNKSCDDIGSVSGTFPGNVPKIDSRYNTEYIKIFLVF